MLQVVDNNQHIPDQKYFIQWINIISQYVEINTNIITIRIVSSEEIQQLNQQFRDQNKPTNVLSFPANLPDIVEDDYLGDIIICADVVEQEAVRDNKPIQAHWAHMLVHGALHLSGYDHIKETQAQAMEALEATIMQKIGFDNPYEL